MDLFTNRLNIKLLTNQKSKESIDADVVEYLRPLSIHLDVDVKELVLLLHTQKFYLFDDIEDILGIEELEW